MIVREERLPWLCFLRIPTEATNRAIQIKTWLTGSGCLLQSLIPLFARFGRKGGEVTISSPCPWHWDSITRHRCYRLRFICRWFPWNQPEIIFCYIFNIPFIKGWGFPEHLLRTYIYIFFRHLASLAFSDASKSYIRSPEQNLPVDRPHLTAILGGSFKTQVLVSNAGKSCPRDKKRGDNR